MALDEVLWLEQTELWGAFRVSKLFDIEEGSRAVLRSHFKVAGPADLLQSVPHHVESQIGSVAFIR